jgi:hypothetical protein
MVSRTNDGSRALFIFAADDYKDVDHKKRTVSFKLTNANDSVSCIGLRGKKEILRDGDTLKIELESNEAAIVTIR